MKIAYEHILRFLVDKPNIQDLSSKLFQLGHEHEIENSVFDIEFTPNRGDCLSVQGIVRDLNVFYETNLNLAIYDDDIPELKLNFINDEEIVCPQISFLNIEIKGNISEYKDYLKNYFNDLKLNKNNFFTDISNYVAYETGQPTHSYDFSNIDNDITLKINTNDTKFTTLLNSEINLNGSDLVFTSNKKIINLSGIMGGLETSCSNQTTNALIECAYFKPESIIGKAVKYNLHSDASHKFERGTDPECHEKVLRRFIQIVSDHVEISKLELFKYTSSVYKKVELDFNLDKVNSILGFNANQDDFKKSLIKLGFEVGEIIKVPSFRNDITHQNDLAEELARVIGYDNIPARSIELKKKSINFDSLNEKKIKHFLVEKGFSEVINAPFCQNSSTYSVEVDNPLDSNRRYLRTNLKNSLVKNILYNENRQKDSIKVFEISDLYIKEKELKSSKRLSLAVSGRKGKNYKEFSQKMDEKYLISIFDELNIDISKHIKSVNREELESKIKTPIYIIELDINEISKYFDKYDICNIPKKRFIEYEPISEFPSSSRDLSFSLTNKSKINHVIESLENSESQYLKESFMFDFFDNKKTDEIKIGYRFTFQAHSRTLLDEDISDELSRIIEPILQIDGVTLPGF